MKFEEKHRALDLRRQGWSYSDILREVAVSKSTLSLWLREIPLTDEQIALLSNRFRAGREKFSRDIRVVRDRRWAAFHAEAELEYRILSQDPQFMFGLALYIGEGSKTCQNTLCLTNCNPQVIQKGIQFFRSIGVQSGVFRCAVQVHQESSVLMAEKYWQSVTNIPALQFYRTTQTLSRASSGKKTNVQVYGTCQVNAYHTRVRQKIERWMQIALQDGPLV